MPRTYLGEECSLPATVTVEYTKESILQVLLVLGLLVRHPELIFHVFPAALVLVAGHPQVEADAGRHAGPAGGGGARAGRGR